MKNTIIGSTEWKEHPNFPGYLISPHGQVMSIRRKKIKEMKIGQDWQGYCFVSVYDEKHNNKNYRLHNLVAECFLGERKPGLEINHMDFNKKNNDVTNLEWCTHQENTRHQHAARRANYKLTGEDETKIYIMRNKLKMRVYDIANEFKVTTGTIYHFLNHRLPKMQAALKNCSKNHKTKGIEIMRQNKVKKADIDPIIYQKEWLTLNEAAAYLDMAPHTMRTLLKHDIQLSQLRRRIASKYLFSRIAIDDYIKNECKIITN